MSTKESNELGDTLKLKLTEFIFLYCEQKTGALRVKPNVNFKTGGLGMAIFNRHKAIVKDWKAHHKERKRIDRNKVIADTCFLIITSVDIFLNFGVTFIEKQSKEISAIFAFCSFRCFSFEISLRCSLLN